jgi:uncharacterized protein YjeT (DUF2065 family)
MKNKLARLRELSRNNLARVGFTVVGATAGSSAFADAATQTAITDAYTSGSSDLSVAITGLIGLVALMVGVGMIISMLRKG